MWAPPNNALITGVDTVVYEIPGLAGRHVHLQLLLPPGNDGGHAVGGVRSMSGTAKAARAAEPDTSSTDLAAGPVEEGSARVLRLVFGALAALLVLVAARLPVWQARLSVKQYPDRPLALTAYGNKLTGDVAEIKILNHYVGLKVFDMADLPETKLWIPAIAAGLLCVALATFTRRRSIWDRLGRIGLWPSRSVFWSTSSSVCGSWAIRWIRPLRSASRRSSRGLRAACRWPPM